MTMTPDTVCNDTLAEKCDKLKSSAFGHVVVELNTSFALKNVYILDFLSLPAWTEEIYREGRVPISTLDPSQVPQPTRFWKSGRDPVYLTMATFERPQSMSLRICCHVFPLCIYLFQRNFENILQKIIPDTPKCVTKRNKPSSKHSFSRSLWIFYTWWKYLTPAPQVTDIRYAENV